LSFLSYKNRTGSIIQTKVNSLLLFFLYLIAYTLQYPRNLRPQDKRRAYVSRETYRVPYYQISMEENRAEHYGEHHDIFEECPRSLHSVTEKTKNLENLSSLANLRDVLQCNKKVFGLYLSLMFPRSIWRSVKNDLVYLVLFLNWPLRHIHFLSLNNAAKQRSLYRHHVLTPLHMPKRKN